MCLGIPGELVAIEERHGMRYGTVRFAGISREVCLECVPAAQVGEYVLVHVGLAIARLDREEAERTYAALEAMGMTEELSPNGKAGGG